MQSKKQKLQEDDFSKKGIEKRMKEIEQRTPVELFYRKGEAKNEI